MEWLAAEHAALDQGFCKADIADIRPSLVHFYSLLYRTLLVCFRGQNKLDLQQSEVMGSRIAKV